MREHGSLESSLRLPTIRLESHGVRIDGRVLRGPIVDRLSGEEKDGHRQCLAGGDLTTQRLADAVVVQFS